MQVFAHPAGSTRARPLSSTVTTPAAAAGGWMRLGLDVTPSRIVWTRHDTGSPASVTVSDSTWRGGYLHIGRVSTDQDASASYRNLRVS
jgi:glycerophosphoryl diester phosphodiesterase